jgi:hypothetical protein
MAENHNGGGEKWPETVTFVIGLLAVLIALWFYNGGPSKATLKGIFLEPPPPLGTGDSYGPQIGQPNPNYQQATSTQ